MHVPTDVLDILYLAIEAAETQDAITHAQMIKARNVLDDLATEES